MAENRNVEYDGIGAEYAPFEIDGVTITHDDDETGGSAQVGLAVTLTDDKEVGLTEDADPVKGILVSVEADGRCLVQTGGYMELPKGAGATFTLGGKVVGDLGAASAKGYVRGVNSAVAAELAVARGEVIDESDANVVGAIL